MLLYTLSQRPSSRKVRALRPAYSLLDKSKVRRTFGLEIPHWRESMQYCLARILKAQQQQQAQ